MINVVYRHQGIKFVFKQLKQYLKGPYFWNQFASIQNPDHKAAAICFHINLLKDRLSKEKNRSLQNILEKDGYSQLGQISNPQIPTQYFNSYYVLLYSGILKQIEELWDNKQNVVQYCLKSIDKTTKKKLTRYILCHNKYLNFLSQHQILNTKINWGLIGVQLLLLK